MSRSIEDVIRAVIDAHVELTGGTDKKQCEKLCKDVFDLFKLPFPRKKVRRMIQELTLTRH